MPTGFYISDDHLRELYHERFGDNNDRPDVEFNNDGSVHVNHPGDYFFASDDPGHVHGWRRTDEQQFHHRGPF